MLSWDENSRSYNGNIVATNDITQFSFIYNGNSIFSSKIFEVNNDENINKKAGLVGTETYYKTVSNNPSSQEIEIFLSNPNNCETIRLIFEYIQKFIGTLPLKKGGAYYGILGANGSMARIHCKFKGKDETMMVSIRGKKCNNELKMDDLVLVGVDDVRKGLTLKKALEYGKLKDNSKKSLLGALVKMETESSIGTVLKIVKPEMNSETMKFDTYDE